MRVFGLEWQFGHVAKQPPLDLPPKARDRLRALHLWKSTGNCELVTHTFQISRATLYRWRQAFDPADPRSLHERSRRPHHFRTPQWPAPLVRAVRRLREQYPRWGRTKLAVLLRREGLETSPSTVGRILRDLRRRGQLHEPRAYAVASALGGGQRLRMAPYVTEDGATGGHPPPEGAKVGYAQVSDSPSSR